VDTGNVIWPSQDRRLAVHYTRNTQLRRPTETGCVIEGKKILIQISVETTAAQYPATSSDGRFPVTGRCVSSQPARLLQRHVDLAIRQLDPASSVGHKRCSTADL